MQQIKHTYKDYDIYIVWYNIDINSYNPWIELSINQAGNKVLKHYQKFDEYFVFSNAITTDRCIEYCKGIIDGF